MPQTDILVVDDNPTNLDLLSGLLQDHQFHVRAVTSGRLALTVARTFKPALILLDINMPQMNGFEVCTQLKADPATCDIPVIFISALDETMDKVRAFEVGGVDYVTKPFQIEEVLARVNSQLRIARLQHELIEKNAALTQANADLSASRQELAEANIQLREMAEIKANFTAMLVHDLKSPLSVVKATLDFLSIDGDVVAGPYGALVHASVKTISKILAMIGELLEVFRTDSKEIHLRRESVKFTEFLKEFLENTRIAAQSENLVLETAISPNLPDMAIDVGKLERALSNLLSNAIKFTPAGGTISVEASEVMHMHSGVGQTAVLIRISDTGEGIEPDVLPIIFDPYRQGQSGKGRLGVGLGLAIVKRIVEAHGGTISATSQLGKGTTFTILLPVE
ncbi:MAG TPA: hybrid sensor histidine kinase/response regulator [Acidobacteriota bacterium]|nr:hybrid sensor histidine kinase/response regulator [Acidobacteriota bacterium]